MKICANEMKAMLVPRGLFMQYTYRGKYRLENKKQKGRTKDELTRRLLKSAKGN